MSAIPESENRLSPAEVEKKLGALQPADWQRLKIISNTLCAGVSDLTAADLLQEAMVRLLSGKRIWPSDLPPLVVLANVMHSIASNARKREADGPVDGSITLDLLDADVDDRTVITHGKVTITPEDELSGKQQIAALYAAMGGDEELELLVMAWADKVRGDEARAELGWDEKKYDAVRKRLMRRLAELDPDRRKL